MMVFLCSSIKILRNIDGTAQKEHHRYEQELITDEQINQELKMIFGKINDDTNIKIDLIKKKKYFTDDIRKELLEYEKKSYEFKKKEINEKNKLSDKAKMKQLNNIKETY